MQQPTSIQSFVIGLRAEVSLLFTVEVVAPNELEAQLLAKQRLKSDTHLQINTDDIDLLDSTVNVSIEKIKPLAPDKEKTKPSTQLLTATRTIPLVTENLQ